MTDDLLRAALAYLKDHGFSLIPIRPTNKKPFLPAWEEFQTRKPTENEIREWWKKHPQGMIGVITGKTSNLFTIDADTPEAIAKMEEELLPETLTVPTVITPRGGRHYHFAYSEGIRNNNNGLLHVRGEGGYAIFPPSKREDGGRYEWLGGDLSNIGLPEAPEALINYLNNYLALGGYKGGDVATKTNDPERPQVTPSDVKMFVEGRRDEDLFHIANCLIKGGAKEDEVLKVLEILALNCDPPFPLREIPEKLKSALKRAQKKEWNISEEVREFVVTSFDAFLTSDVYQRLQVTSREEKKAVVKALLRLHEEGLIERCGGRNGCYRRVETECEVIDFLHAPDESLPILYPLKIEQYFKTFPKNILVVAGSKDSGKTAFLLNFARLNMNRFLVHYFSSEMGAIELKKRLQRFDLPLEAWKINAKERNRNFGDVIRPDDINIVDYLEVDEDFYRVGGMLREIYEKLNKGVAIVAIQKNRGRDTGVGGERSLEKPRLYVSLENGKAKIVVAKNWATEINPVGLELDFKLAQGCKFIVQKDWYRP